MNPIILVGYLAVGSLMKFTDEILDTHGKPGKFLFLISLLTGILYGAGMGFLMSIDFYSVYVFGAIIVACLLTGKIDNRAHIIALFTTLFILFTSGGAIVNVLSINWLLFLAITVPAILDETSEIFRFSPARRFFRQRFGMRVTLLLLSLTGIVGWAAFINLIAFDIAYTATGGIFPRLMPSPDRTKKCTTS